MREKLVKLIEQVVVPYFAELIADVLIRAGVVTPVRCKECKKRIWNDFDECYICHPCGFKAQNPEWWCADGEKKADGE